jgi:hypothetical protein
MVRTLELGRVVLAISNTADRIAGGQGQTKEQKEGDDGQIQGVFHVRTILIWMMKLN